MKIKIFINMTEPPDKDFYKTIKVPLKHIIKNFEIN